MSVLFDVILSISASIISFYLILHAFSPRICFSDSVCFHLTKNNNIGHLYRIKMQNRDIRRFLDIEVQVRFSVQNMEGNSNLQHIDLKTSITRIPFLGKMRFKRILKSRPERYKGNTDWLFPDRIVSIYVDQTEAFGQRRFPESIRLKYFDGTLTLEDVLNINETARFRVYLYGYDGWSGARKVVTSKDYQISDIKPGQFRGIDIVPRKAKLPNGQNAQNMNNVS